MDEKSVLEKVNQVFEESFEIDRTMLKPEKRSLMTWALIVWI